MFLCGDELVVIVEGVCAASLDLAALQQSVNKKLVKPSIDVELVGFSLGGVHKSVFRSLV